jgi:hypothetical protein
MQQPVLDILSHQGELAAIAGECTEDVNEARLLVHKVMSRAFAKYSSVSPELPEALRRDLRALARAMRAPGQACA